MAAGGPSLWPFALAFYAQPGAAAALLRLQDECGADVCLILYLFWRAAAGVCPDIAVLDAAVAPWREGVIRPLRAVRRALPPSPLRDAVKADELEAELLLLLTLERFAAGTPGYSPGEAAAASLAAYAAHLGVVFPADALAALMSASV